MKCGSPYRWNACNPPNLVLCLTKLSTVSRQLCRPISYQGWYPFLYFQQSLMHLCALAGDLLCSGSDDRKLAIWDVQQQRLETMYNTGHGLKIFCSEFLPHSGEWLRLSLSFLFLVSASRCSKNLEDEPVFILPHFDTPLAFILHDFSAI